MHITKWHTTKLLGCEQCISLHILLLYPPNGLEPESHWWSPLDKTQFQAARQLSSFYQHHDQFVLSFGCKSPNLLAEAIGSTRLAGSLMSLFWQTLICFNPIFAFSTRAGWRTQNWVKSFHLFSNCSAGLRKSWESVVGTARDCFD